MGLVLANDSFYFFDNGKTVNTSNRRVDTQPLQTVTAGVPAVSSATSSDLKLVEGFGKGLLSDVKGKAKFLKSDVTDGLSLKV